MSLRLRGRIRLQRRRLNHRYRKVRSFALIMGGIMTLLEWVGYAGKFRPWGDPKPLSDVWWHFPIYAAVFFLLFSLWPFRLQYVDWPAQG